MYNPIKTKEIGNYRIKIYYDLSAQCPCTDWDMVWSFLWSNDNGHNLSESCNWLRVFGNYGSHHHSMKETVCELIDDYVDWTDLIHYLVKGRIAGCSLERNDEIWTLKWNNEKRVVVEDVLEVEDYEIKEHQIGTTEFLESFTSKECLQILNDLGKDIIATEWATIGYSQGDYAGGIAFCTKSRFEKIVSKNTDNWKKEALKYFDGEEKCVGMWMWGDVKGFTLEEKVQFTKHYQNIDREDEDDFEWEEIDSCWGYYMDTDELIDEVISEHDLKESRSAC